MNIKPDLRYMLNPAYTLFPDNHCAFIANSKGVGSFSPPENADGNFLQMITPVYALFFSYWDGKQTYSETLEKMERETHIDKNVIEKFLEPCFDNSEKKMLDYKDQQNLEIQFSNWIPPHFIIPAATSRVREDLYPTKDFLIPKDKWDFKHCRSRIPLQLSLMLTNKCMTNCLYCYADKKHQIEHPLSADKWISIIEEADKIGCLSVDIVGGEVFMFPGIERILQTLYQHQYPPYLSTKIPLNEERIMRLKEVGVKELQFSIDAWDSHTLQKLLAVPADYFERLKQTLRMLEKHQITVKVKSVITKYNDSLQSIEKLLQNLTAFGNIEEISLAPAEFSIYKKMEGFLQYRTTLAQWRKIEEFRTKFCSEHSNICNINCQVPASEIDFNASAKDKQAGFKRRARCTGNITGLFVLADGKAGICEELYWDPRFIIGDLRTQKIQEVWESPKALSLYHLSQDMVKKESACHTCNDFAACHQLNGVCWKYVIEAYGSDNWDYPDPRCPLAPPIINSFFIQ